MSDLAAIEARRNLLSLESDEAARLVEIGARLAGKAWAPFSVSHDRDNEEDLVDPVTEEKVPPVSIHVRRESDGTFSVFPRNVVGVVSLGRRTLVISPKIEMDHFVHLMRRSLQVPRWLSERIGVEHMAAFWEVLAEWCLAAIADSIRPGLMPDYQRVEDEIKFVRGRVDVVATTNNFLHGRLDAHCEFEEFEVDTPLNRVLRRAVELIANEVRPVRDEVRIKASRILHHFHGVSSLSAGDLAVRLDRRMLRFQLALDFAKRLIAWGGAGLDVGSSSGNSFLLRTDLPLENGIRRVLIDGLRPIQVADSVSRRTISRNPYFSINPDLKFGVGRLGAGTFVLGDGQVIGDVKYKIANTGWERADVAQISMFAAGFRSSAGVIVDFRETPNQRDLSMEMGSISIHKISWNASSGHDPEVEEADFVSRIREVVSPFLENAVG